MKYFLLELFLDDYEPIVYDIKHIETFEQREQAQSYIDKIHKEISEYNINRINRIKEYVKNIYIPSKFPEEYEEAKAFCLDWFDKEHVLYYSSIRNDIEQCLIKGYGLGKNKTFLYDMFPKLKQKREFYILEIL